MVTQRDWEIAFDGIDMNCITVYQVFNAPAILGLANHIIMAEKQGVAPKKLKGIQQNDVLKEYLARGNYIFPPAQSMRLAADIFCYVGQELPLYHASTVCGQHLSERGTNCIREAAFALADAFAFLQAAVDMGADIDSIAPGMMFQPACDHYVFWEEIAKLRAMRKIYARVLKERFKAKKPESLQCRFYAAEGGTSLHREQYLNNIGRITLATLVGALSGCEIIDTRAYDEQYGIPTTEAQVNEVRLQNVVKYETGVDDTADPLAGSYYLEWLTLETEERVWKEMEELDKRGGMLHCIETGYAQSLIAHDAYQWQKRFESGELKRVGVNIFPSKEGEEEKPLRIYRTSPAVEAKRKEAIVEIKKNRDNHKVNKALDEIKATARLQPSVKNNLVPPVIEAAKNYATVGEVCGALREVWGEYRESWTF